MKFTVATKTFSSALARVQTIATPRATMPVLANVMLCASALKPVLHISATDLEVGYQTVIDCEVEVPGQITLPAKKLFEVIKLAPTSEIVVELQSGNDNVVITAGTYIATIAGLSADGFPEVKLTPGEALQLDAAALLQLLGHIDYAQSADPVKYNLSGTFLRLKNLDDELRLYAVATDGHRIAVDSVPLLEACFGRLRCW